MFCTNQVVAALLFLGVPELASLSLTDRVPADDDPAISVWYFRYRVMTGPSAEGGGKTRKASAGGVSAAAADRTENAKNPRIRIILIGYSCGDRCDRDRNVGDDHDLEMLLCP